MERARSWSRSTRERPTRNASQKRHQIPVAADSATRRLTLARGGTNFWWFPRSTGLHDNTQKVKQSGPCSSGGTGIQKPLLGVGDGVSGVLTWKVRDIISWIPLPFAYRHVLTDHPLQLDLVKIKQITFTTHGKMTKFLTCDSSFMSNDDPPASYHQLLV